jgi:large subunit ribosomal protein L25
MADIALLVEPRPERGSAASKRLRALGRIPAVIYGHGDDPVAVSVDGRDLRAALSSASGENALFNLELGSTRHLAIAREFQRHPVRHTVAHIDFQVVSRDELVHADVPIQLTGEALGVTRGGGNVEHALFSLHVMAKPAEIPPYLEVDITDLQLGASIRLLDIELPSGVTTEVDPETAVVIGQVPRGLEIEGGEAGEVPIGEPASSDAPSES